MPQKEAVEVAPSIGAIGEVRFDKENLRHKGLLLEEVNSEEELKDLLERTLSSCDLTQGSRITLRCFSNHRMRRLSELLTLQHQVDLFNINLEGAIPINGGRHLLYFGGNLENRIPSPGIIAAEVRLTNIARQVAQRPVRQLPDGYRVELIPKNSLDGIDRTDLETIVGIYEQAYRSYTTSLNFSSVSKMVQDGLTGIVRDKDERIVSITIGEIGRAGEITICEISDSATDSLQTAKGLNIYAKAAVIKELVKQGVDLIFTETRANQAAVQIGNFRLGMEIGGYLPRHCRISSDLVDVIDSNDQGFGNLFIFYLPEEARKLYE